MSCTYVIQLTWPCDGIVLIREVLKVSPPGSSDVTRATLTFSPAVLSHSMDSTGRNVTFRNLRAIRDMAIQVTCTVGSLIEHLESSKT